jgi:hypothetical protein
MFLWQLTANTISVKTDAQWVLLGVTAGLIALTNPVFMLALAATSLMGITAIASSRSRVFAASLVLLGFSLVMAPWVLRNYFVFDGIVMKSAVGHTFLKARETSGDTLWIPSSRIVQVEKAGRHLSEVEEDALLKREVFAAIRVQKLEFVKTAGRNFVQLWWEPHSYSHNKTLAYVLGRKLPYLVLLALALIPLLATLVRFVKSPLNCFKHEAISASALIFILSDTIAFSLFGAWNIRYHLPSEVMMIPFLVTGCLTISAFFKISVPTRYRAVPLPA